MSARARILLIDNYDSFTYNLVQAFLILGAEVDVHRNDAITVDAALAGTHSHLVISPGPGTPRDAGVSMAMIRAFAGRIPIFGVCLGHQSLVEVFGGKVVRAARLMHGKVSPVSHDGKGLFDGLPPLFSAGRYHSLIAEPQSIPEVLEVTARTPGRRDHGRTASFLGRRGSSVSPRKRAHARGTESHGQFPEVLSAPAMQSLQQTLEHLLNGRALSEVEAGRLLEQLTAADVTPALAGALLAAVRAKGVVAAELRGFAAAMRALARKPELPPDLDAIDIVGTGGDFSGSLNLSTGAALLAASCGLPVVKHGNRSVTSRSGSADLIEQLGLVLPLDERRSAQCFASTGFTFLFAPYFHPAMKALAPVRAALGVRTVLNLLGPLTNPAAPRYRLIGAYDEASARLIADALAGMPIARAWVVHGANGWDEATPIGPFVAFDVTPGAVLAADPRPGRVRLATLHVRGSQGGRRRRELSGDTRRVRRAGCRTPPQCSRAPVRTCAVYCRPQRLGGGRHPHRHRGARQRPGARVARATRGVRHAGCRCRAGQCARRGHEMSDFLAEMARSSAARSAEAAQRVPLAELRRRAQQAAAAPPLRLSPLGFDILAEIKLRSPAAGALQDPAHDRLGRIEAYARGGAAAVSVLTEPSRFDGTLEHLREAATVLAPLGVPVMRKDFLVDPYQVLEARAAGAGGVLLILRMLTRERLAAMLETAEEQGLFVLLEAFDERDLDVAGELLAATPRPAGVMVGINCRDLTSLAVVPERFAELAARLPPDVPAVAESGVATPADAQKVRALGYRLALVGTALMARGDAGGLVAEMLAAARTVSR